MWKSLRLWPGGPEERQKQRTRRNILRLPFGPVVAGKCPSQGALLQSQSKVEQPKEEQQVGQLEPEEVAVVGRVRAVGGKETLGSRTQLSGGGLTSVEALAEFKNQRQLPRHTQYHD